MVAEIFSGLGNYFAVHPLLFHSIIIAISFAVMVKSADMLVFGISGYSKRLGLSDYLVGLLIVSLTASVPEFVSSVSGIIEGDYGIVFGTILGSNITGITLALGILALVGRKLHLMNKLMKKMEVMIFFMLMLPFFLGIDGTLSRIDGFALVLAYLGYATMLWRKEIKSGKVRKSVKLKMLWKDALIFLLALAALFLSSRWIVFSSIQASKILEINTFVMAVLVIGIASSAPDLFVGIRAVLSGEVGVGVGNSLGSMIVKVLLFLGIFALITPITVDLNLLKISIGATILSLAFVMYLTEKKEMDWRHGIILLLFYLVYIMLEIFKK